MKGVILAGGLATRLYPLTFATNKHLLPVYDKPMIFYPIRTLVKAGIKEILVVVSGPHSGDFINVLKNGEDFDVDHIEYAYQDNPKGGIADALAVAEDFADNGPVTVILGDNTTDADISAAVRDFREGAVMFLKQVPNPERYGVAVFDSENPKKVIRMEEKPKKPKSNFANTGLYLFDSSCFEYIRRLKPSDRGELEVVDLQNLYIERGEMQWFELEGYWLDAGTFDSLLLANLYWAKKADSENLSSLLDYVKFDTL